MADVSVSPTFLRLLAAYVSWADIVHLTAVYSFPSIACKILGKPLVWSPRGMLQRWDEALALESRMGTAYKVEIPSAVAHRNARPVLSIACSEAGFRGRTILLGI